MLDDCSHDTLEYGRAVVTSVLSKNHGSTLPTAIGSDTLVAVAAAAGLGTE
jgi:hypothetical protein